MKCNHLFPIVGRLCLDDLVTILTELLPACVDWYNIGLALNIRPTALNAMKAGTDKEPKDCLRDMLIEWLSASPDPSWEGLIAALRHPIVGKETLARQLETKCCTQASPQGKLRQNGPFTIIYIILWGEKSEH